MPSLWYGEGVWLRSCSTTAGDRNLPFRGAMSTGVSFSFSVLVDRVSSFLDLPGTEDRPSSGEETEVKRSREAMRAKYACQVYPVCFLPQIPL